MVNGQSRTDMNKRVTMVNQRIARQLAAVAGVTLALAGFSSIVRAQDAAPATDTPADDTPIVVTGSRIARPEAASANPVVAMTADTMQRVGTANVTDFLKSVPALTGSAGAYDNSGSRAPIGFTGLNLLDLRNLGYDRTLVLIDGRRHVGSVDGLQAVDINTIPQDLIQRVDVLTGGASAIYGADAVSGVVNFIMKRDFEGISGRGQIGVSSRGDAGQRLFDLTAGHNFAGGRGNITLSWEHGEEDRLDVRQRGYLSGSQRIRFAKNPVPGGPTYVPLDDIRYFDTSRQGGIDVDFDGMPDFVGAAGAPFDHGSFVPDFYQRGGSGTLVSDYANDLAPQVKRDILNGLARFQVSDALELYAEGKYARTRSFSLAQPTFDYYLFIPQDNPYIPAAVQPLVQADPNGVPGVFLNRDNFDFGQRGEDVTRETVRAVVGAKGTVSPQLKYDLSFVYGQTTATNRYINNILTDRYYAAIDAVQGPNGITCRANLDPNWTPYQPYNYTRGPVPPTTFTPGQCQPLNLFGEGVGSRAAIDWIKADTTDRSRLTQTVISGSISGNLGTFLKLPGGPIAYALGGEYRRETSSFTADPLAQQGLTFGNVLGNSYGKFDVKEGFAEVSLPVLADAPFARQLTLGGALRLSDYSSIGKTTAWKLDGFWEPVRAVAFRGTYSVAVRAPNIGELYGAPGQTFAAIDDPCNLTNVARGTQYRQANCATLLTGLGANPATYTDTRSTTLPGLTGSNPGVREEQAKTWTAGVILRPDFAPRLLITADWYNIRIGSAILTATAQQLAELCVDQQTVNNQYCALIARQNGGGTPGFINGFTLQPFNVATYHTAGLDLTLDYSLPTATAGTFRAHVVANYLHRLEYVPIPGAPLVNEAYTGGEALTQSPKVQVTGDFGWQKGPIGINWRATYFAPTYRYSRKEMAADPNIVAPEYLRYKARFVNDLSATADIGDQFQIYGGVNNLFDVKPDIGSQFYPVNATGRFVYIGARVRLADVFGR